jgi:predicted transcriptional regulator
MKEQVAEIVAAYLRRNSVAATDVPAVIVQVYQALAGIGRAQPGTEETGMKPAVPIRRSVTNEFLTCLECGAKAKMLRRHLKATHNLTTDDYRARWNLPLDYPVVAPNYRARRSEIAKTFGLGRR